MRAAAGVLGVLGALVAGDLGPAASAPASADASVDLFKAANAGSWTPIRNSGEGLDAYARLDAAGDAALVTWQGNAQLWCGAANWPRNECAGGRFVDLVVQPRALPGAGEQAGKVPIVSSSTASPGWPRGRRTSVPTSSCAAT
jgi:hypothetical protein